MARLTTTKTHANKNGQFKGNFFINSSDGKEYRHERVMPGLLNDIQTAELGLDRGDETKHSGQLSRQHNSSCEQYSASANHPFMRDSSGVEYWIDTGRSPSTLKVHNLPNTYKYTHPSERSSGQADIDQMLLSNLLNDNVVQFDYASSASKPKQKDCAVQDREYLENVKERRTKKIDKKRNTYFIDSTDIINSRDISNEKHVTVMKDTNEQKKDTRHSKMCWTQNNYSTNVSSVSNLPATNHSKKILVNSLTSKLEKDVSEAILKSSNSSSSACKSLLEQKEVQKKAVKRNSKVPSAHSKKGKLSTKASNIEQSEKLDIEKFREKTMGTIIVPETEHHIQHCRRYESGDYDDDSDLSVLTANYIRSTKFSKGANSRQSKSFLKSIKVMDREASTKSLILHANKSTETSTDFAQTPCSPANPAGRTRADLYKNLHYRNEEVLVKAGLLRYTCSENVDHVASPNPNQSAKVYPVSHIRDDSDSIHLNYSSSEHKKDLNNKLLITKEHSPSDDTSSSVIIVERKSYNIKKSKDEPNTNNVNIKNLQSNYKGQTNHHREMCSVGCITDDTILINEKIMQATLEVQKQDIDNLIDITKNALKSLRKSGNANSNENCPQWTKNSDEDKLQVSSHENHKLNKRRKSSRLREKSYALRFADSDDSQSLVSNRNTSRQHGKSQIKHTATRKTKQNKSSEHRRNLNTEAEAMYETEENDSEAEIRTDHKRSDPYTEIASAPTPKTIIKVQDRPVVHKQNLRLTWQPLECTALVCSASMACVNSFLLPAVYSNTNVNR